MRDLVILLALSGVVATAFPDVNAYLRANEGGHLNRRQLDSIIPPPFDASQQLVDVTGEHEFVPPGPGDQRGPCPGLNALAASLLLGRSNHNFLPHNGIATIDQFITQTTTGQTYCCPEIAHTCNSPRTDHSTVFGLGPGIALFLAVYGAVVAGDLTQWSIGGPDARVPAPLGLGLLGQPQGISGSHNKYENDGSPTRGDLYQVGNDYLLQMNQWQDLYDVGKAEDDYNIDNLIDRRAARFQESIDTNPYFFYGPISGFVAEHAAWSFIFRLMGNKSSEYPAGKLDGEVLKSFYAITGDDGDFAYTPGHERIYTRNALDPYDYPEAQLDAIHATYGRGNLEFLDIGGNTGTPGSFVGFDPDNITSNVYSIQNLQDGNNLSCYFFELTTQALPDILLTLFSEIQQGLDLLTPILDNATQTFGCPKFEAIDKSQFGMFPGYTQSYDGYTGQSTSKSILPIL
ncbi:Cloroperoxidase [Teratosphaeria destructans]|uniref:Cloroperoxidase n=1 Tax=Teratosphaeria destructans TaxID=418781 RepID=A0A9W7SWR4_9PEZI|nr:Cloroperoxidase [Teratosphaeria destructans]